MSRQLDSVPPTFSVLNEDAADRTMRETADGIMRDRLFFITQHFKLKTGQLLVMEAKQFCNLFDKNAVEEKPVIDQLKVTTRLLELEAFIPELVTTELNNNTDSRCDSCAPGQFSPGGYSTCQWCGKGETCPEGDSSPRPCMKGNFCNAIFKKNRAVWGTIEEPCKPGTYCLECPASASCSVLGAPEPVISLSRVFIEFESKLARSWVAGACFQKVVGDSTRKIETDKRQEILVLFLFFYKSKFP